MEPENVQEVNNIGVHQLPLAGNVMMPPTVGVFVDPADVHGLYSVDPMGHHSPYLAHQQHYHGTPIQDYLEPSTSSAADSDKQNGPQSYDEVFPALPEQSQYGPLLSEVKLNGGAEPASSNKNSGFSAANVVSEKGKKYQAYE